MSNEGSLRAIKVARDKKKKREADLEGKVKLMEEVLNNQGRAMERMRQLTQELVNASNASSVLLSSIERWMDENHTGWDEGIRKDLQRKSDLIREAKQIRALISTAPPTAEGGPTPEERGKTAEHLWEISKELGGVTLQDGPLVISLLLQSKRVDAAKAVLAEYRALHTEIPPQLEAVLRRLDERVAEVERSESRIWLP